MFKRIFPFALIYTAVIILYHPALTTYFSNDDFFHFKVSITDGSLRSFIKLFGFYSFNLRGIAFYRPLFREALYNIFYRLFELNELPFRILQFLTHFINIYLVFKLIQRIFKKRFVSFFAAFFFGISSANVATFYYLAGGVQIQGATMFILLTLLLFDSYLDRGELKFKILSFLTFLAAISSHEQAALIPLVLCGIILVKYRLKEALKKIVGLWAYFVVIAIYLFLNIKLIGYSSNETQYHIVFNLKITLNTFAWYTNWALGTPEMLIDFVNPGFKLNPNLMRYWGNYFRIIFPALLISVALISLFLSSILLRSTKALKDKRFWFFILWFPLGLLPVVFLPQHKSTYYLYSTLPAFWTIIGIITYKGYVVIKRKYPRLAVSLVFLLTLSLTVLSTASAFLGRTTYWAASRGELAEKIIKDVKSKYPTLPPGSGIYFTNDPTYPFVADDWRSSSKQAYFALNGEDGLQLVYKDPSLRVFYEDTGGVSSDFPKNKINPVVAIY